MDKNKFDEMFNSFYIVQDREEFYWLVSQVEGLNPKGIIEIGVENGGTARFWLEVLGRGGIAIGIDHWPGVKTQIEPSLRKIANEKGIEFHIICAPSELPDTIGEVANILKGREVDFLFIDATHTNVAAKSDFNYSKFVRAGGLVGFHDILGNYAEFWNSLSGRKEIMHNTLSTGIWWKDG